MYFGTQAVLSGQVHSDETLCPEALLRGAKTIFQREMMDFIPLVNSLHPVYHFMINLLLLNSAL